MNVIQKQPNQDLTVIWVRIPDAVTVIYVQPRNNKMRQRSVIPCRWKELGLLTKYMLQVLGHRLYTVEPWISIQTSTCGQPN